LTALREYRVRVRLSRRRRRLTVLSPCGRVAEQSFSRQTPRL